MNARKREALLSFAVCALFFGCAKRSSSVPADAASTAEPPPPAQTAPVSAAAPTPKSPPPATLATASATPPAAETTSPTPTVAPIVPAKRKAARAQTERDCKACSGDWGVHGLSPTPSCNCRTSDSGKRCRDAAECEGLCTAGETPAREITDQGPPARGFFVGRCSAFATVFGCYRPIEAGAGKQPIELTEPPQTICAD